MYGGKERVPGRRGRSLRRGVGAEPPPPPPPPLAEQYFFLFWRRNENTNKKIQKIHSKNNMHDLIKIHEK